VAKRDDDSASDMDVGMTTAERRRRRRRGGGLRVPSDNVPRRSNPPVVAPVPEDPSLAMSIAYSFGSETSDRVDMRDNITAPDAMPTVIEPSAPVEGQDFEMKTREMTAVDLEALGLSQDALAGRNGEDSLARTDPSMPALPGLGDLDSTLRGRTIVEEDVDLDVEISAGDSNDAVPAPVSDERAPTFEKRARLKTVALTDDDLEEVREAVRAVTHPTAEKNPFSAPVAPSAAPTQPGLAAKPRPSLPPPVRQTGQVPLVGQQGPPGPPGSTQPPAVRQTGQVPLVGQQGQAQQRTPPQPTPAPPMAGPPIKPPSQPLPTEARTPTKPPSQPLPAEARTPTKPPAQPPPAEPRVQTPSKPPPASDAPRAQTPSTPPQVGPPVPATRGGAIAKALSDSAVNRTQPLAPQDLDEVPMSIADIDVQELSERADVPVSVPDIDVHELAERAGPDSSGEIEINVDDSQPVPKRDKPASVPPPIAPQAASTSPGAQTAPPPPPADAHKTKAPPAPPPTKAKELAKAPPPSMAAAMKPGEPKRGKPWFVDLFDEDYLRTLPFLTPQATQAEAEFVIESMGLQPGAQVLDVGCGYGRHAMELAARGYHIVGLDLSTPLLVRGGEEAHRRNLTINFVRGDMRELDFDSQFDGAYCLFSTFGYFDDETNKKTIANIARALKPGGRVLIEILNRDYVISDLPTRVWWEGDGCVVLEEVELNYFSSRVQVNRSVVFDDGRQLEQEISVRAYSLHEVGKLMHAAGFRVLEVSGGYHTRSRFFGNQSRHIIVLAERKDPSAA